MSLTRGRKPGPVRRGTALGAFLAAFRLEKGWSQDQLQEALKNANAAFAKRNPKQYVSKIETGAVQFPKGNEFWDAIATLTGKSQEELQDLARQPEAAQPNGPSSTASGSPQEVVIADAQKFVEKVGPENLDIWLLGPQSLPVVDDLAIQDVWVKNLSAGATYRVVWFLDQVLAWRFSKVSSVLADIGVRVSDSSSHRSSKIVHYATQLLAESKPEEFEGVISKYNEMKVADMNGNTFLEPLLDHPQLQSLKERLQLFWQKFSAIVVYCPRTRGHVPRANLRLMEVSARPGEHTMSPFFWFSEEHAYELQEMLSEFRTEYEKYLADSKSKAKTLKSRSVAGEKK